MFRSGRVYSRLLFFLLLYLLLFSSAADCYILSIERPVSPAEAVTLTGSDYVVEPHSPGTIKVAVKVLCDLKDPRETPPATLVMVYELQRNGGGLDHVAETITPSWKNGHLPSRLEAVINYLFQLPRAGTGQYDLRTGSDYAFEVNLQVTTDPKPGYDTVSSSLFSYTVYSGKLFFNQVLTRLQDLSPGTSCDAGDMMLEDVSTAEWTAGDNSYSFDAGGLCVSFVDNPDGYSTDLQVRSGTVSGIGPVRGSVSGLEWFINAVTLDSRGGAFSYSAITLPDGVTVHASFENQVWPRGHGTLSFFDNVTFSDSLESVVLSRNQQLFFHTYALPFYVETGGVSIQLSASNTSGIQLADPVPYYVHKDAFDSLSADHHSRYYGFASNDSMFRKADDDPFSRNTVNINGDGMQGHLEFEAMASDIAFPRARIDYPVYGIDIVDGALADHSALTGHNPVHFALIFDGNCPGGNCGQTLEKQAFRVTSDQGACFFPNGALAGRFDNLGEPADPESSRLSWGGVDRGHPTFFRNDHGEQGVWVIPGFIMPDTAATPTAESSGRIGQTLFASFTFNAPASTGDPIAADAIHLLNHPEDYAACHGDGYFAGINMGPEILNGPSSTVQTVEAGVGTILSAGIDVRFNGNTAFTSMSDSEATKYNLRPGGLTGVFNTGFPGSSSGDVAIYGYNISFSRFSFRQQLNNLSPETFIDGELTLPAPVGDADGLRIGFTGLALTCNGNLGNGILDNEPEADWPDGSSPTGCDGIDNDGDSYVDEGCHVLGYWAMPVLLTGMSFVNDPGSPASSGDCNTRPRVLRLNTMNVVKNLGSPLTMSAVYTPDGLLRDQKIFGIVDTWFDRPAESNLPGFSMRLADAYLNEVTDPANLPPWSGFTVLTGQVDVPLFNDPRLKGHFINSDASEQSIYMMEDGNDTDHDGITVPFDVDDNAAGAGCVSDFRSRLAVSAPCEAPKPLFEYHWPAEGVIDLSYRADFQQAGSGRMPSFAGISKSTDLAGVLTVDSLPDYINPQRTKFSFGISADTGVLENLSIDVGGITEGINDFLHSQLGVDLSFDLEGMLAGLTGAEEYMHDITGGDVSDILGEVVDQALQQGLNEGGMADYIRAAANGLKSAHQAPCMVSGILTEPFETLQKEIVTLCRDPDLDFAALAVDVNVSSELEHALAPFLRYDHQQLRALYEDFTGVSGDPAFDELLTRYELLEDSVSDLVSRLDMIRVAQGNAEDFLTGSAGSAATNINDLIILAYHASDLVHELYDELTLGLGNYATASDSNELLRKLQEAKDGVRAVKDAIEGVHLGDIADALFLASIIAGSPMDVSMLHSAEDSAMAAVEQLDQAISQAEQNMTDLLNALPLADILATVDGFLGDSGLIQHSLRGAAYADPAGPGGLVYSLESIRDTAPVLVGAMGSDLERVFQIVSALVPSSQVPVDVLNWPQAVQSSQEELDHAIGGIYEDMQVSGESAESLLFKEIEDLSSISFYTVLVDPDMREIILTVSLQYLVASGKTLQGDIEDMMNNVTGLLPNPTEEDIRAMIRSAILNTDQVQAMNMIFFEQFGFVSDMVDDVSTQITHQINNMVREAIASINEGLQQELDSLTADIGSDWGVASAGIDGYALVSQDEIERVHLEAEFTFAGDPDPTSYNGALDISTWNSSNERSGCTTGGTGNIDIVLSTHDVTADMLGMDVGLKEALLGFTMQTDPVLPVGVFGRVYLMGELNFETLVLYDLGFESAFGAYELYFAARGAARFSDYNIPMAAFYLGTSCGENNVLERLDPEVAEFIGDINPMSGVYVRGAVEVPVWNNGCALSVGVGADIGAWYFTEPHPGTYGGLLGGSAYGELACLASLKGAVSLIGQKSGSTYSFAGNGWGAAGVGYCSPGKWRSVSDARKDDWCLTGDATFGVTYDNCDWNFNGPDVSCCH